VWACSAHPHLALARTAQCFQGRVNARQRAQIVLLAADGAATREISWQVGCTIGTASKWRVRYAWDRLTEPSEVGERGAKPKYGEARSDTDRGDPSHPHLESRLRLS
jgi:hypothetical protein